MPNYRGQYCFMKEIINNKRQIIWTKKCTKLNVIKADIYQRVNPNINKKDETVINRLRIGHNITTHGFLMSREDH